MKFPKTKKGMFGLGAAVILAFSGGYAFQNIKESSSYRVIDVKDGDTLTIEANFLPPELGYKLGLRVIGVNTPEKGARAECDYEARLGEKASEFTRRKIETAKTINIKLLGWDKYGGRVIGEVIIDGKSLSNMLLQEKLAHAYDGKSAKQSWCKKR